MPVNQDMYTRLPFRGVRERPASTRSKLDVARTYNNMANVYRSQGHYERALEYYQKDLDITIVVVGHDHIDVADTYINMGNV